jgi:hypothetical protein
MSFYDEIRTQEIGHRKHEKVSIMRNRGNYRNETTSDIGNDYEKGNARVHIYWITTHIWINTKKNNNDSFKIKEKKYVEEEEKSVVIVMKGHEHQQHTHLRWAIIVDCYSRLLCVLFIKAWDVYFELRTKKKRKLSKSIQHMTLNCSLFSLTL